jgi:hypothetical protein
MFGRNKRASLLQRRVIDKEKRSIRLTPGLALSRTSPVVDFINILRV